MKIIVVKIENKSEAFWYTIDSELNRGAKGCDKAHLFSRVQ